MRPGRALRDLSAVMFYLKQRIKRSEKNGAMFSWPNEVSWAQAFITLISVLPLMLQIFHKKPILKFRLI